MRDICKQDVDRVLLVEGINDCHVVMALCQAHQVPKTFGIYQCGGKEKVLKRLNALIVRPNPPQVIGCLLDVDPPSIESRWDSIKDKLRHYSYPFANRPDPNGTIVKSSVDQPTLGFWLMPNNRDVGMLEDFCAELAEPTALAFAKTCVENAGAQHLTTFKAVHHSKAIIHTYLAWQDEPGRPMGQAITAHALRPQTEIAVQFTHWLTRLFSKTLR